MQALGEIFAAFGHLPLLTACASPPSHLLPEELPSAVHPPTAQQQLAFIFGAEWPPGAADVGSFAFMSGADGESEMDAAQRAAMLESCLHLLLQLTAHTPRCGAAPPTPSFAQVWNSRPTPHTPTLSTDSLITDPWPNRG